MTHQDRRGLAEIVAWVSSLSLTFIALMVCMLSGRCESGERSTLFALFTGNLVALMARGTKGAIDRDAQKDRDSK